MSGGSSSALRALPREVLSDPPPSRHPFLRLLARPATATVLAAMVGAFVLAVSQIPHAQGIRADRHARETGRTYAGYPPTYADEAATYLHWIKQGREGRVFFTDRLTPEPHPRNYVNVLFWGMGTVGRVTGWSDEAVYAGSRVVLGAAVLLLLWMLACRLFERGWERLACFLPFAISGGWEGVAAFVERNLDGPHVSSPLWWTPQINTFFSLMTFPHLLASFVAMLGTVLFLLRAWRREGVSPAERDRAAFGAGLIMIVLTFFHPFDDLTLVVILWAAPVAFALAERRVVVDDFRVAAIATVVWLPALAYNAYIFRTNHAMRAWDLQNVMTVPEPSRLLIAFGISGLLALVALARPTRLSRPLLVMAAWIVAALVLAHMPFRFQRRMLGGIHIPFAALGTIALVWAARRFLPRVRPEGIAAFLLAVALLPLQAATPFYLLDIEWGGVQAERYPAWIRVPEASAMDYLNRAAPPEALVLASYEMGNVIPSRAPARVFLGHYALTIDAREKEKDVHRFFGGNADDDGWRKELLARWGVGYVFHTAHERTLGGFDPSAAEWLSPVFSSGDDPATRATVYEVRLADVAQGP